MAPSLRAALVQPPEVTARGRILRLAEEHFLTYGFRRVTMAELARELGMSKKTLYVHFLNKQSLLDAMLEARLVTVGAELAAVAGDPALDYPAKWRRFFETLTRRVGAVKPPFMHDLRRHAPASFKKIEAFRQQMVPLHFGRLLAEGRERGMIRKDLPVPVVVELVLTAIQAIVTPEGLTRLGLSPQAALSAILQVVFEGVLAPSGRSTFAGTLASPSPQSS